MKTETIEVPGLPEGWKAVAYRVPKGNIEFVFIENMVREAKPQDKKCLIVEKIQPRRIVLEETEEIDKDIEAVQHFNFGNTIININSPKIWREVKETDEEPHLKLTKKDMLELIEHIKLGGQLNYKIAEFIDYEQPEPKLSLSVDECKEAMRKLETFNVTDLSVKICRFLKDK